MPEDNRFAVYFSHSWRPRDVDLDVQVWNELSRGCELLFDVPEVPGANPPYYINRIEELLRRTDLFLSLLTYREPSKGEFLGADANLRCSPYCLFEIRLAERAEIPRLVLYERSTGFRPPRTLRPWEAYIPFDRGLKERLVEQRQWDTVIQPKIQQWQEWARNHRKPMSYEQSTYAALLTDTPPVCEVLENELRAGGYEPVRLGHDRQRSSEAFRLLREAGLVVAEFARQEAVPEQLYAAAHGLGIPAIRLLCSAEDNVDLPWILQGDAGGYQDDIVRWKHPEDVAALVRPRITAMFRLSPALRDAEGLDYLQSKRYSQFFVFISHTLKGPDRAIVEYIFSLLKERHVTPFEYHQANTAGIDWREALDDSLRKTTHFIVLLSSGYEQSPTCTYELEQILARGEKAVTILPYMLAGRDVPHPKLTRLHNKLSHQDPRTNAESVVQEVMPQLDQSLQRSGL
jgi:hypothetical protein